MYKFICKHCGEETNVLASYNDQYKGCPYCGCDEVYVNAKWLEENYHIFDRINLMSAEEVRAVLRREKEL